jgi:Type II intron maturase.
VHNLHTLSYLKYVMEVSLVKTLANKYRTRCRKIYRRFGAPIETDEDQRQVILVKLDRKPPKEPLIAYFSGVSPSGSERGRWKSTQPGNSLAVYPTSRPDLGGL